ncbi:hypothetical protein [Streptomyces sp. NPDC088115]|uniref:hypothetical protein n=1 Tax=Streptomyces sp. NPDC088115 TaxID=3365824 RepID=UPI00382B4CE1
MNPIPPNTYATYAKGLDLPTLTAVSTEASLPVRTAGESDGWAWVTYDATAVSGPEVSDLARDLTGFRYDERFGGPDRVVTVFLASTPACECPHGRNYSIPHCDDHPVHYSYSRGGFELDYFNIGMRREVHRSGDRLIRELLAAGIVGRETPVYDADPSYNADGSVTMRIITEHFGLPTAN